MYAADVPRLWNETIDAHRHSVREAILDTTANLAAELGLMSVTMSKVAEQTGIGRATLYKYFPDVDAILSAWHERQIAMHLEQLTMLSNQTGSADERLEAVLTAYAKIAHNRRSNDHSGADVASALHRGQHTSQAEQHVHTLIKDLLTDVSAAGQLRADVSPDELATYCLHSLGAASNLSSKAAVDRLVTVTITGLRPNR